MKSLVFLVIFCCFCVSFGKVEKGNIHGSSLSDDWIFVSKFCFDTRGLGNLSWSGYSPDPSNLKLLFYDDLANSWPYVYSHRHSLSCEEKISLAKGNRSVASGEKVLQSFNDTKRPHFWYVVISNCGGASKLEFQYEFEFLNAGGAWTRQFSFDEQGLVGMFLFFWLVFMIASALQLRASWVLAYSNSFHPVVRLLTATVLLENFSLLCTFIHYAVYAKDGVGANGMKGLGEILDMTAQLVFMFLLVLMAKGWSITRNQITGQRLLLVMVSVFLIGYVTMFTWENVGRNHASTLYIYESAPGIIILVLRVLTMAWFLWELRLSHREENDLEKRRFYSLLGVAYSCWFLALVLIVLIAVMIPAWDRAKVVTGMYLVMNTIGFCSLEFLLWPSRASQYFRIAPTDLLLASHNSSPYETL